VVKVSFSKRDYKRSVANEAYMPLHNRYYEENPVLSDDPVALIARPGAKKLLQSGPGPIRGVFSEQGTFNDALFFVSENELHRFDNDGTDTDIGNISGFETGASVSFAATANIGEEVPEYLFIADGSVLWLYTESGPASGILTASAAIANSDVIRIDTIYYQWTSGSVDAGTPAGTLANPWLVALGATNTDALTNMYAAINGSGVAGTAYSTSLTVHPTCVAAYFDATSLGVRAKISGIVGNAYVSTETGANIAWAGGTLTGGGTTSLTQVPTPDDVGIIDVLHIASYVICVPAQGEGINGRFYWIEPGETTIDPLNFATAESAPDPILQAVAFGDQFWLCGSSTTEVWFPSGDFSAPMQRLRGVAFSRGTWEGTAVQVKDSLIIVDNEGGVFQISGGVSRISTPDIEEQIRNAIQLQELLEA
jgi:hypothetical protein